MRKFLLVFLLPWVLPFTIHAQGEFHTKYLVDYHFDALGNSTVKQQISLTNLLTQVYASSYQFTIPYANSPQITGFDAKGPLKITTTPKDGETLVNVEFNDYVVGKGNSQQFSLTYPGQKAVHNGQIWEIILPGLGNTDFIDDYQLSLSVDPALGKLAFISPSPNFVNNNSYIFTKDQLTKIGVVAAYGNFQTFAFDLKYQLENTSDKPVYTEIAIPADTNYQRVFYDSITPAPVDVRIDEDGNWLARYDLQKQQKLEVVAIGQVHLLAEPVKLFSDQVQKPNLSKYLVSTHFWPSDDPQMRLLGQSLKTPEAIYDYVANKLVYDFDQTGNSTRLRKGGKLAYLEPTKSVCLEFTDLFITLARAAGIPAREVDGYAYATDANSHPLSLSSDILHAWPQYWDEKQQMWINIDPTWANTTGGVDYFHKLDFNHFAFVIHGVSDSEPLSAGMYKTSTSGKNVNVQFATYKEYPQQDLDIQWKTPWQIFPVINNYSFLNLTNNQGQAKYHIDVHATANKFILGSDEFTRIVVMPPFGKAQIPVTISRGQYLNFSPQSLIVRIGAHTMTYNIRSRLYLAWHISVGLIASLIIVGLAAIAGQAGSIHFQRPKPGDNLRGQGKRPAP